MVSLVTGGAGFIGSSLVEDLEDVVVVDDLSTANEYSIRFVEESGAEFIKGSITDLKLMKQVLDGVETVYHQAAIPSVPRSIKDPLRTNQANIGGTLNLLVACWDAGVRNLVYASSSSVYGDTPALPKVENMPPNPKSPYAITKLMGEHYMRVFNELYGLRTVSLRYFNVFGPRQNPDSEYSAVIPKFVKAALAGQPITIYGDGLQTRDFTYVTDVVEANKKAAGKVGIYNIAGGKQITIRELADKIVELTGSRSEIEYVDERKGDVKHSLADITKAGKKLAWQPKYTLEQGLKEYIDCYSKLTP